MQFLDKEFLNSNSGSTTTPVHLAKMLFCVSNPPYTETGVTAPACTASPSSVWTREQSLGRCLARPGSSRRGSYARGGQSTAALAARNPDSRHFDRFSRLAGPTAAGRVHLTVSPTTHPKLRPTLPLSWAPSRPEEGIAPRWYPRPLTLPPAPRSALPRGLLAPRSLLNPPSLRPTPAAQGSGPLAATRRLPCGRRA